MFVNFTKICIVIEPRKGKLIYYENPSVYLLGSEALEDIYKR